MATPYNTLLLSTMATPADVRRAYRVASLLHHPDKGGNPSYFRLAKAAYDVLIDPIMRHGWDQLNATIYKQWARACEHEGIKAAPKGSCGAIKRPKEKRSDRPAREAKTAYMTPTAAQAQWQKEKGPRQERPTKGGESQKRKSAAEEQRSEPNSSSPPPQPEQRQSKPSRRNPTNPYGWNLFGADPFASAGAGGSPENVVPDDHPFARAGRQEEKMSPKTARQRAKAKERREANARKEKKKPAWRV